MHDTIPCQVCGAPIHEHWRLWAEHLHRPMTEAELKSLEWQATKALTRLEQKIERGQRAEQRGKPWRPPLTVKLKAMFQ
jgi:hypothetical protein